MAMMETRFDNLRAKMREEGIDAIYVNSPENHLYVSGFDNPDGWLLVTLEKVYVFADFRYTEAAKADSASFCEVCLPGKPSFKEIAEEYGIKTVGYEDRRTTCANFNWLKKQFEGVNVEYAPLGGFFTDLRDVKSPEEVESIIAAQRIAEGAFEHILKVINYNMTEVEVAAELEYWMKKTTLFADMHTHSENSHDSCCKIEDMVKAQIKRGSVFFAVTDHFDTDLYGKTDIFTPIKNAATECRRINEIYGSECTALCGVELGEGFWNNDAYRRIIEQEGYDVVLGSIHQVRFENLTEAYARIDFSLLSEETIYA